VPARAAPVLTVESTAGTYQPYLYFLPGLVARTAGNPYSALRLGRMVSGAIGVALLGLAVAVLWDPDNPRHSLLGLVVATTPMVVFMVASLNPNGSEIAGGICFIAGLLQKSADRQGEPLSSLSGSAPVAPGL